MSNVTDIQSTESMMKFLQKGRADVALTNTVDGNLIIKKLGYTNIIPIDKPLAVLDLFTYIYEDHKALVPTVDAQVSSNDKYVAVAGTLSGLSSGVVFIASENNRAVLATTWDHNKKKIV